MTPASTLFTANLALHRASSDDFWEVWDIWAEPDICARVFGERPQTLTHTLETYDAWLGAPNEHTGLWMIRSLVGGQVLGCVSLARRRFSERERTQLCGPVEFQIALRAAARGRGLAIEAARSVLRHAFCDPALPFVMASSHADDTAIHTLLSRLGFEVASQREEPLGRRYAHMMMRRAFTAATDEQLAA